MNSKKDLLKTGDEIKEMKDKFGWQVVYCTKSGCGFTADKMYRRTIKNDAWIEL
jgi:hypothetical protein